MLACNDFRSFLTVQVTGAGWKSGHSAEVKSENGLLSYFLSDARLWSNFMVFLVRGDGATVKELRISCGCDGCFFTNLACYLIFQVADFKVSLSSFFFEFSFTFPELLCFLVVLSICL